MSAAECRVCGGALPKRAAFCPQCGSRVEGDVTQTAVLAQPAQTVPLPAAGPAAAGPATDVHHYGVTPPMALLALGIAALAVGVLLIVLGSVFLGVVVLVLAVALVAAFAAVSAQKRPESAAGRIRERARSATTTLSERTAARRDTGRLLHEREQLRGARTRLLLELGRAVDAGDEQTAASVRAELAAVDTAAAEKDDELQALVERSEHTRLEGQPTEPVPVPVPGPSPAQSPQADDPEAAKD